MCPNLMKLGGGGGGGVFNIKLFGGVAGLEFFVNLCVCAQT